MYESKSRALYKAISWRIFASLVTIFIVAIITGDMNIGTSVGLIDFASKIILYYLHERLWNNINLGKLDLGR